MSEQCFLVDLKTKMLLEKENYTSIQTPWDYWQCQILLKEIPE